MSDGITLCNVEQIRFGVPQACIQSLLLRFIVCEIKILIISFSDTSNSINSYLCFWIPEPHLENISNVYDRLLHILILLRNLIY